MSNHQRTERETRGDVRRYWGATRLEEGGACATEATMNRRGLTSGRDYRQDEMKLMEATNTGRTRGNGRAEVAAATHGPLPGTSEDAEDQDENENDRINTTNCE